MGREDKRFRERATTHLTKRLRRKPTEEEIEKEVVALREAQGLDPRRDRDAGHTTGLRRARKLR
jgi:hypothetical protein